MHGWLVLWGLSVLLLGAGCGVGLASVALDAGLPTLGFVQGLAMGAATVGGSGMAIGGIFLFSMVDA